MKILNLGSGVKVSSRPEVINIDWSIYLRIRKNPLLRTLAPRFLKGERLTRFNSLPDNIMVHNLAKGIPFANDSVDVVYHSHLLEHLDRDVAPVFLSEVRRVLKRDGIQRIVVPDLEKACRAYLAHLSSCENEAAEAAKHDAYVATLIEQSVRREGYGTSHQTPLRRFIENRVLGDARKRGETHQWMYDRVNLGALLLRLGFRNPTLQTYRTSSIPDWNRYGLDLDESGHEYKPESLYLETQK